VSPKCFLLGLSYESPSLKIQAVFPGGWVENGYGLSDFGPRLSVETGDEYNHVLSHYITDRMLCLAKKSLKKSCHLTLRDVECLRNGSFYKFLQLKASQLR